MKTAIHLGYQIASLTIPDLGEKSYRCPPELTLHQPAFTDEHFFHPAMSVSVGNMDQLRKLRDFLNEHIKDEVVQTNQEPSQPEKSDFHSEKVPRQVEEK